MQTKYNNQFEKHENLKRLILQWNTPRSEPCKTYSEKNINNDQIKTILVYQIDTNYH